MNRLLLLVGAMQGWGLWALWKARELKVWPSHDPLSERSLLYICLAVPLAFYLTQNIPSLNKQRRKGILILIGVIFALLGVYSGWAENIPAEMLGDKLQHLPLRPADMFAAAILGFIGIPLLVHFERAKRHWSYLSLFETAWRNALMCTSSVTLTGVFWMVLFAGAMLMKSIGLDFIFRLIKEPIFSIPVTGIVFAAAFSLGLARAEMIITLRRFWLSISSWLLPLLLLFSVMWVIAVPFTGLDLLFKTHNAGLILMWFLALSINFANAAYQSGESEQPYGKWLGKLIEYAWLSLPVLAMVAWWAMLQRISQYGWTEDRVWGVFVLLLITLYTLGYAYSVKLRHGWLANIGKTNIVTALVICAGLLLLLSPLADARRIAVYSQMQRLLNGEVSAEQIDYAYLRWQAGRYGQDALNKMVAGIDHKDKDIIASKATQTLAQTQRYSGNSGVKALSVDQLRLRLRVLPKGEALDESLLKQLTRPNVTWQEERCMQVDANCLVWMIDLNNDGLKEAVLITILPEWSFGNAIFYQQITAKKYRFGGNINFNFGRDKKSREKLIAEIESGKAKTIKPRFDDINIDGKRISVSANRCDNDCDDDAP